MKQKQTTFPRSPSAEDALVSRLASKLADKKRSAMTGVLLGIGDDAALWRVRPGYETILTCDWFLEGVHFLREMHPAHAVGWKCLARAVSDIAAMGGMPKCFLLSLALPETHAGAWLEDFLKGLRTASRRFCCPAAGGDTTRHDKILINVSAMGEIEKNRALLRSGARPGDLIFVSGRLGEAELGLVELRRSTAAVRAPSACLRKHLCPEPRLALGRWLASNRLPTAMLDISDGLSSDLPRLCAASGVGAQIEESRLPLTRTRDAPPSSPAQRLRAALDGGDDYELLFTVPEGKSRKMPATFAGIPISRIGTITKKPKIVLLGKAGNKESLRAGGWDPFRQK